MTAAHHTDLNEIDAETDAEFEQALTAAEDAFQLNTDSYFTPFGAFEEGSTERVIAAIGSPWVQTLRTVFNEPDADDVDGVAPGHLDPEPAQSVVFDAAFEADDEEETDELTFEIVEEYENSYGDDRAVVETPAPWDTPDDMTDANEVVKTLPWGDDETDEDDDREGAHYTFNDDDPEAPPEAAEAWALDAEYVPDLKDAAEDTGYEWVDSRDDGEADEADDEQDGDALDRLTEVAEEGDHVTVRYRQKNGNGIGIKSGEVTTSSSGGEDEYGYESTQGVVFERDDGNYNRVKRDDNGTPGIFSHSQYPFMGTVLSVEVVLHDGDTDDE